jgi:crossover junction endodeoxyribonuclease RuvC
MRVLGLDPGSRRTGFGVVEKRGNRLQVLGHGCLVPPAKAELPQRLAFLAAGAADIMERFAPDCVVVEEAFYHENVRSTLVLGHVRGALIVTAVQREHSVAEYSPREIKMSVTGNGGATKEQVGFMVQRLLGIPEVLQADAADALAGAICHLNRAGLQLPRRTSTAAKQLQALLARAAR